MWNERVVLRNVRKGWRQKRDVERKRMRTKMTEQKREGDLDR